MKSQEGTSISTRRRAGLAGAFAAIIALGAPALAAAPATAVAVRPISWGALSVHGIAQVGSSISVSHGTWTPGTRFVYQWLRGGKKIAGATGSSYRPVATDIGKTLRVKVVGWQLGYHTHTLTSRGVVAKAGVLPTIRVGLGSAPILVGETLEIRRTGTFLHDEKTAVQWYRAGAAIAGATGLRYTVAPADYAKALSYTVTASLPGYTTRVFRSNRTIVSAGYQTRGGVSLSGEPAVDATLTAVPRGWPAGAALGYQWYRDGEAVPGATGTDYDLTAADSGHRVLVVVTSALAGYRGALAASDEVVVRPGTQTPGTVSVSGAAVSGAMLSAATAGWAPGATLAYQWLRDGSPIPGATGPQFQPSSTDAGTTVSVAVTSVLAGHADTAATSASVAVGDWYAANFPEFTEVNFTSVGSVTASYTRPLPAALTITATGNGSIHVTSKTSTDVTTGDLDFFSTDHAITATIPVFPHDPALQTAKIVVDASDEVTWTLHFAPMSSLPLLPASGTGIGTYRYEGPGSFLATNAGSLSQAFRIEQYHAAADGTVVRDQLAASTETDGSFVDVVSAYAGPSLITVTSSAAWTMIAR